MAYDSWGKQKKYCLKANWVDFSQARNVVSGRLYSQIAKTLDLDDEISDLNNGGVVDGYPVLVFENGVYHGLYTLNIPKDKWMFGMSDSDEKNQAILMGDAWTLAPALMEDITKDFAEGVALEYYSNEDSEIDDSSDWIVDSFNAMSNFVRNNDGDALKSGISEYLNVERCIDCYIYTTVICALDNTAKNVLWVTYDGKTWQTSPYDMDGTWGMRWDGEIVIPATSYSWKAISGCNDLWSKFYRNYYEEIKARYLELREDVLSLQNIQKEFAAFFDKIPTEVVEADKVKWSTVPGQDENNYAQIIAWAEARLAYLDGDI